MPSGGERKGGEHGSSQTSLLASNCLNFEKTDTAREKYRKKEKISSFIPFP